LYEEFLILHRQAGARSAVAADLRPDQLILHFGR
jgi:hypothetical protein